MSNLPFNYCTNQTQAWAMMLGKLPYFMCGFVQMNDTAQELKATTNSLPLS